MANLMIYNPNASNGTAHRKLRAVRSQLDELSIPYDLVLTERAGHAMSLARENADRYDVLIAAGGDGTVNEVINGIMLARRTDVRPRVSALGLLCVGRGNDFAHAAGVPGTLREECEALKSGQRKRIDVGFVTGDGAPEGRYFGNGLGIGFDTIVSIEASKIAWAQGFVGYVIGAIKTIFFYYDPPELRLKTDNIDESRPLLQVSAMNGRRMGGAFYMAPCADISDGLFDICIAGAPSRREMLGLVAKFLRGTQKGARHIEFDRSSRLEVSSPDGKIVMHVDGETLCTAGRNVTVEIIAGGIEVVCPTGA